MSETVVIRLPIARVAEIERQRAARGKAERVAYVEDIPLSVRSATDASAPVALTSDAAGISLRETWRVHEGRVYRPLWKSGGLGCTVADAATELARRAAHEVSQPLNSHWPYHEGERVQPMFFLRRADGERGIGPQGHHPVRRTIDDGRAAQAADAAVVQDNLLLVDGLLHHAAPLPGWQVGCATANLADPDTGLGYIAPLFSASRWHPYANPKSADGINKARVPSWFAFGPEARHEAVALAETLASIHCEGLPRGRRPRIDGAPRGRDDYRIVDRAALETALPPDGPAEWLARVGGDFLSHAARSLGGMGVDGVEAYLDARKAFAHLAGTGGQEDAYASLTAFVGILARTARPSTEGTPDGTLLAANAVMVRYETFERHRTPRGADAEAMDMDSLSALAAR